MMIKKIKRYLETRIGDEIIIIYYGSRNKKEKYEGVLCNVYNNVFIVKLSYGEVKSFSYSDVLIKTIQICI